MATGLPFALISAFAGTAVQTSTFETTVKAPVPPQTSAKRPSSVVEAACRFAGPSVLNPSELVALLGPDGSNCGAGFIVKDNWLGQETLRSVQAEVTAFDAAGRLQPAGMGKSDTAWASPEHRGDRIMWLSSLLPEKDGESTPKDASEVPSSGLPAGLRSVVNRVLDLSAQLKHCCPQLHLNDKISIQLACYVRGFAAVLCRPSFVFDWRCRFVCQPGNGARYVRHVDVVPPDDPSESMRKVTVLYYLNSEWMESRDGGALRLFLSSSSEEVFLDIFPHADRMLAFLSDVIPHEVLPAFATRYSVTVWLYGTAGSGFHRSSPLRTLSPYPSLGVDASDSIFVTIPCYRDTECQHTVQSLFAQAARPDRVFVGICWQLDESDEQSCCNHSVFTSRRHQIRSIKLDCRDAAGPVWARHLAMSLWRGEAFVLQIDSHMRFVSGWDDVLIHLLSACCHEKPVLSTYPPGYSLPDTVPSLHETPVPVMCFTKFGEDGFPRFTGKPLKAPTGRPIPSLFWAAGFSFSRASLFTEVPHDATLKHLFFGEEVSYWARAWSHGWRVFAPGQAVVYHLWSRSHRPTFREHATPHTRDTEAASRRLVLSQFLPRHCECSESRVHAFLKSIGLDFVGRSGDDLAAFGGLTPDDFA